MAETIQETIEEVMFADLRNYQVEPTLENQLAYLTALREDLDGEEGFDLNLSWCKITTSLMISHLQIRLMLQSRQN